ncbi:dynein light chain Tctex-type protein 2B-like [Patiria miniata]|uniref:Uncharacterized protein n=1 Tax=Patiria miniata TaxID=46514 RepID=A0A913ZEF9_PATMI|nr:dynein light chain Tctex-type protein 2B-like [Patiria miniata]
MEKLKAKLLMPTVVEDDDADSKGNNSDNAAAMELGTTVKAKPTLGTSRLATWNLLKRKISSAAAGKGVRMGSSLTTRSRRLNINSTSRPTGPKMENTYHLKPDSQIIFKPVSVVKEITDVLKGVLGDIEYNPAISGRIATRLAEAIKTRVKALQLKRHKLVVQVVVGSQGGQSLQMASRCLWNQETDNSASASYQSTTLFAIASVYGIYFE